MATQSHILILGAGGFIGSACARAVLESGDRLTCLAHRTPLASELSGARTVPGSLPTFPWRSLEADPPTIILHLARLSAPGRSGRRIAAWRSARANRRLLSWLEGQAHPPLLVLVAGTLAYGPSADAEVYEEHPLNPVGFARQYARREAPVLAALQAGRLPVQIMRPAWVYGPRSWLKSFYLDPMRREGFVPLYGSGENWMSLIHVEDAARWILRLAQTAPTGTTFNLVSGAPMRQTELAERLSRISGLPVRRRTPADLAIRDSALWESLTFSQRTATRHAARYHEIGCDHPDPGLALESLWRALRTA
ncbi:MAG TPA: NAD(P)-dependent oxidoreductase [bacterium]|nr:NAD(P)-dependent oxidoreductase [bacterium]